MRTVVLVAMTATFAASIGFGQAVSKKRIAIFDFDNAAVQGPATMMFMQSGTQANPGKSAANLLVGRVVKDGIASVIERGELEKLFSEQNLTNSDRTDPATAAKLGRILGVDVIVLGSVTNY